MKLKKKKEAFVTKGKRQIAEGNTSSALETIAEGLDFYQEQVLQSISPYPVADAALLVVILRTLADEIESENPDCKALVADLTEKAKAPKLHTIEKFHKTKRR